MTFKQSYNFYTAAAGKQALLTRNFYYVYYLNWGMFNVNTSV